jgi:hypothetical protein
MGPEVTPRCRSADTGGAVELRVEIDEQDAPALLSERCRHVDGQPRLAHAAFLVGDRDRPGHVRRLIFRRAPTASATLPPPNSPAVPFILS